jgi:DNA-binding CsgD family transcriptional regulator
MSAVTLPYIGSFPDAGEPGIGDRDAAVYRYATRCGELTSARAAASQLGLPEHEVYAAVAKLVELHLLRADDTVAGRLVPMNAEVAVTQLISPIERAMFERRDQADRLRDRIDAITRPETDLTEPVGAIDALEGVAEIRGLFKLAGEVCRDELVVLRPSHDDEELLDELLEACYGVLDRDVAVRVVCPHRSRAGFASRAKAKRLMEDGAQIRTLSEVPQAAVVFDSTLAVMFGFGPDGELTARRVRDRNVVRFLIDMFDQLWDGATPYASDEPGYADAIDDLQQSVARLMAQGLTDEVVARRLGMSVRTCRRHIAALLQNLDSTSRFQAGVQAAGRFTINAARGA